MWRHPLDVANIAQFFGRDYVFRFLVVVESVPDFGVVNSIHVTPRIVLRHITSSTMRRFLSRF